jgi:hypothetical protein
MRMTQKLCGTPRKVRARFNAYRTLTSIKLKEDESLLSLIGCVSTAMNSLKDSRPKGFSIDQANAELQAVVLLIALPDESGYNSLKAPFEMSTGTLSSSEVKTAYANYQVFKTAGQEGDSTERNPLSGAAIATVSSVPTPSAALAVAPPVTCIGCLQTGHSFLKCKEFHNLIRNLANNKGKAKGNGADAKSQVASNASLLSHFAFSVVDFRWNADSGTTSHMTNCKDRLKSAYYYRVAIEVANGVVVYLELVGEDRVEVLNAC